MKEPESKAETGVGLFEMVDRRESDRMIAGLDEPCSPPLTQDEWFVFLDAAGQPLTSDLLR